MNTSEMKELFWKVFHCNGEDNLHEIVCKNESLQNPDNWYPYGGRNKEDRSNFGTFENQQAHSGAALVEKITNSIDALLLKRCKQEGIDPKSINAPKTMEQATEQFFDIPKGDIGELLGNARTELARENLQVIATGNDDKPDLMIYDNGEGQHPDNFKNTFLSIANNNKTDIAFVQGKYNMGSTGAVVFCGEYRYQLIASKQDENIFKNKNRDAENLFGWTLVRRHILTSEENQKFGSSWYEYFAIEGEQIPQFPIDKLDIGLVEQKQFTTGSFIKLFSYEMPQGSKGAIHSNLYREFNQLLYKPALPFWLFENRKKYKKYTKTTNGVYGNHVRINSDSENGQESKDILECNPIYENLKTHDIGEVTVYAIVFKKGDNQQQQSDRKRNFIGSGRNIIYTLNGQVQGNEGQTFITQELKYNFLKDSLLIVIDCSKIRTQYRQDLFMANRSNVRQNEKLEQLRKKVIQVLKDNETLRRLNTERKNAVLQGGDDKKEKELIESILSKVPLDETLTNLLKKGWDAIDLTPNKKRSSKKGDKQKISKETKRFPSIFKIKVNEDKSTGKKIKSIPLNGKGVIQFETDVAEDYFYRPLEKGDFQIHILGSQDNNDSAGGTERGKPNKVEDIFEVKQSGPSDGSIKLTLEPKSNLNVGDEIELNAKLTSPDGDLESIFYVKIIDPQKQQTKPIEKEPEKPKIPKIIKVIKKEDGWFKDKNEEENEYQPWNEVEGWDKNSIIHIIIADEEDDLIVSGVAVNMDSNILQKYISNNKAKSEKDIDFLKNQYLSKMYLHGLFLYSILNKIHSLDNSEKKYNNEDKSPEDFVAEIFKSYGNVLIHLDTNKEILDSIDEG